MSKQITSRHILLKYRKIKRKRKKILKEARGRKHVTYRGTKIRIASDFSSETT